MFFFYRLQLGQVLQKVRDMAEDLEPVIPALIASRKASHRQKSGGITPMLCVHLLSDSADGSSVGGGSVCGCAVPGCVGESQPNSPFGGGFSTKSNNSTSSTGSSSGQKKKKDLPEDPVYKKNLRRRAEDQAILAYRNALAASHDGSLPTEEDEEERPWSNGDLVMMNFRELLWYWREYYLRRGRDRLSIEFSAHIAFHHFLNLVGMSPSLSRPITFRLSASHLLCVVIYCRFVVCGRWLGMRSVATSHRFTRKPLSNDESTVLVVQSIVDPRGYHSSVTSVSSNRHVNLQSQTVRFCVGKGYV